MNRILIILLAVVGIAALGTPVRAEALATVPCSPKIELAVRNTLGPVVPGTTPTGSPITCRVATAPTQTQNGVVVAGSSDTVLADVALSDGRTAAVEVSSDGTVQSVRYAHSDMTGSSGPAMAVLFWIFALVSVGGAVFVITRRNLIAAVMGMVGSFLGIAAVYMMLYAQFLAVVQMLVYAGAIMVLFVFVVMILNRPEDEPIAPSGRAGQALGGVAIVYLVGRLVWLLARVEPPNPLVAAAAPPSVDQCIDWQNHACVQMGSYDWGSVRSVGTDLFGAGLFPFEAISILLLLAVVGAIAIARPLHTDDDAPAKTRAEGAA
jgi:NADH-quinone oxidoreductase subunit J